MEFPQIPGVDRGVLVASFAGAVAYLCTQDKIPPLRALGYVVAGGCAAAFIGPGVVDWLTQAKYILPGQPGERIGYAIIFVIGVCGIWLLNIIVAICAEIKKRVGGFVGALMDRISGNKSTGGDQQ